MPTTDAVARDLITALAAVLEHTSDGHPCPDLDTGQQLMLDEAYDRLDQVLTELSLPDDFDGLDGDADFSEPIYDESEL